MGLILSGKIREAESAFFSPQTVGKISLRTISKLLKALSTTVPPKLFAERLPKYFNLIKSQNIETNHIFFGTIISILLKQNQIQEAEQIFEKIMPSFNIQPNELLYHMFIDYHVMKGNTPSATSVFDQMKLSTGATPRAYQGIIVALIQGQKMKQAFQYIKDMETEGFEKDVVVYTALIKHYGVLGIINKS
jgi:pentatricopeptide repeat protein